VFLLNSRLGHFSAAPFCSYREGIHSRELLFFQSYEDNLPSSLTRVLSRALESSSYPPVSVLVRSPSTTRTYFLEASRYAFGSSYRFPLVASWLSVDGFACRPASRLHGLFQSSARLTCFVSPSSLFYGGAGIFNLLTIAYAFQPRLRLRLTQGRRALPWKP
jgi:hypothetical protein